MLYTQPTPADVIRFRAQTGLTQVDFGVQLHTKRTAVQNWERGVIAMPLALWELANLKLRPLIELRLEAAQAATEGPTRSDTGA